jgi:excisionase family DNA binding protein
MSTETVGNDVELLSVRRAARRLGIQRGTAYNLVRRGVIPPVRVGGSIRIDPPRLDEWLAAQERTPAE